MVRIAFVIVGVFLIVAGAISVVDRDDVGEPCTRQAGLGCLVVHQRFRGEPYTEGAFSFIRITGEELEFERELEGSGSARRVASVALEPGSYDLFSYERPCMGTCPPDGPLDPPTDGCTASFTVKPGAQVTAKIAVVPGGACTITLTG